MVTSEQYGSMAYRSSSKTNHGADRSERIRGLQSRFRDNRRKKEDLTVPNPSKEDLIYALAKGALSAVPFTGGVAAELLALAIASPLERRRAQWVNRIAERLKQLELEVEGFKIENLAESPLFVTVVLHATNVALRTHQEEKLQALQNAVVNSARGTNIDENLQLMLLNIVDDLTPLHLTVLRYFQNPAKWFRDRGIRFSATKGPMSLALETALPELRHWIYDPIVTDLFTRGLIDLDMHGVHTMTYTPEGFLRSRIMPMGAEFLKYISDWRPGAG